MKQKLLKIFAIVGAGTVVMSAAAAPAKRIGVVEDPQVKIYALGATDANKGVYTLSATSDSPEKISGSTYIQYSFIGSGGTFVDENTLYGTAYNYGSTYGVIATAAGTEDGPWAHTFYNFRTSNMTIPATSVAKDMTYSVADEKIYGIFRASAYSTTSWVLATYDGENFTTSTIAELPYGTVITAIAADTEGNLYGIDGDMGKLVSIDKNTAAITEIGSLGVIVAGTTQSAAIDAASGKMYWIANASMYSTAQSMYEVDLATGAATKLYDVASDRRYSGLFIPAPKASATAPAAAENLAAEFTGEGTDMKITFTMPSTTFGGAPLTGDVDYTIYCDGAEVATGTAEAGTEVEKVIALEAGEREISVICSKEEEKSPRTKISALVGFDVPTNISNLTVEADGNTVTLAWTAPTAARGGMLDESKLSYTVTRNPGSVELVSGLKECTFTDEVPDGYVALHTWTVTVNYEGADDQSLVSDGIKLGKPYTVPYTQNFDDATSFGDIAFAQYSVKPGSPQWVLAETEGNKYAEVESEYYSTPHDDYLFTAPIEFAKGIKYTLKFKVASRAASPTVWDWSGVTGVQKDAPYEMSVFLTKGQSTDEADKVNPAITDDFQYLCPQEDAGVFVEQTMSFTVAETGAYSVCFLDKTSLQFSYNSLRIDDIEITAEYPKPAPVSNLTTTAGDENNRDITVSFTAPSVDVDGQELQSLTGAEVYRGTQLIATLTDGVTPGAELTYVDKDSPRGIHSYHVVAINGDAVSDAQYSSVRSGYINNLKIVECSVPEKISTQQPGSAAVTITNDAFETAVDYRVVLYIDGSEAASKVGEPIAPDATQTYTFDIEATKEMPSKINVKFEIEFFGDENLDNNISDEYPVLVEVETGLSDLTSGTEVAVTAANGSIGVNGAEGLAISIYAADGRQVAQSTSHGNAYSARLQPGVYVVKVGTLTYKLAL